MTYIRMPGDLENHIPIIDALWAFVSVDPETGCEGIISRTVDIPYVGKMSGAVRVRGQQKRKSPMEGREAHQRRDRSAYPTYPADRPQGTR